MPAVKTSRGTTQRMSARHCTIETCSKPVAHAALGICAGHLKRWRRYGSVYADVPLGALRGKWTDPAERNRGGKPPFPMRQAILQYVGAMIAKEQIEKY